MNREGRTTINRNDELDCLLVHGFLALGFLRKSTLPTPTPLPTPSPLLTRDGPLKWKNVQNVRSRSKPEEHKSKHLTEKKYKYKKKKKNCEKLPIKFPFGNWLGLYLNNDRLKRTSRREIFTLFFFIVLIQPLTGTDEVFWEDSEIKLKRREETGSARRDKQAALCTNRSLPFILL